MSCATGASSTSGIRCVGGDGTSIAATNHVAENKKPERSDQELKEPEALHHSNDDQPARKVTAWQGGALTESYFRKRDYESPVQR